MSVLVPVLASNRVGFLPERVSECHTCSVTQQAFHHSEDRDLHTFVQWRERFVRTVNPVTLRGGNSPYPVLLLSSTPSSRFSPSRGLVCAYVCVCPSVRAQTSGGPGSLSGVTEVLQGCSCDHVRVCVRPEDVPVP